MAGNGSTGSGGHARAPLGGAGERVLPKRFYKQADVRAVDDGWLVVLDERPVRTPGRQQLLAPSEALSEAIAREWAAQEDVIDPATMPLTRLMNTALDGVSGKEGKVRAEIVQFAGSDLLCYRAEHPRELVELQSSAWDPPLQWLAQHHGVELQVAGGIMPVMQSQEALDRFGGLVAEGGAFELAALHVLVTLSGSAVLGCAVMKGGLGTAEAWAAAHVDEDWQILQWGGDAEAEARRAYRWREFQAAALLLKLF
jgi:chaperone required for assembly of F1-ATPase